MRRCSVSRRVLAASAIALALASGARRAEAMGPVYCTNCSSITTQLIQNARQAQSYLTQLQQYSMQLRQYANMVTNTVSLPQQLWANAQGDIMQVRNLANGASLLSGNSASLIDRLQNATGYVDQVSSLGNIFGELQSDRATIGNSIGTLGRTLGLQQSQEMSNAALLAALQRQSESAGGQMQAIQAGNELAGVTNAQLLQIQSTLSSTAQMEATHIAVRSDRRASEDAAMQNFMNAPPISTTGNPQY